MWFVCEEKENKTKLNEKSRVPTIANKKCEKWVDVVNLNLCFVISLKKEIGEKQNRNVKTEWVSPDHSGRNINNNNITHTSPVKLKPIWLFNVVELQVCAF